MEFSLRRQTGSESRLKESRWAEASNGNLKSTGALFADASERLRIATASTAKNRNGAAFGSPLRFLQPNILVSGKYIITFASGGDKAEILLVDLVNTIATFYLRRLDLEAVLLGRG